ncbi:hypothetical protein [Actinomyces israelii]|uniref:hypothetical protein n=1 Tax=Actinomyces israelii TaxID=1659 RepID=UPI000A438B04|nr:hypothetical protein [Actinomyces israelii]
MVRAAREHAAAPGLPSLLDEPAALSAHHAGLVVGAARAVGDHGRLAALARQPSAGVRIRARAALPLQARSRERLSAAYLAMPLDERRLFEARLHRERRTDVVGVLLGLPLADRDRARLLKSADEARAAELLDALPTAPSPPTGAPPAPGEPAGGRGRLAGRARPHPAVGRSRGRAGRLLAGARGRRRRGPGTGDRRPPGRRQRMDRAVAGSAARPAQAPGRPPPRRAAVRRY